MKKTARIIMPVVHEMDAVLLVRPSEAHSTIH